MNKPGQRALIVLRLSRVSEESTSIERQREVCEKLCADRGLEVVGYAEDPDVSAGTTIPFERPSLGPWLQHPERFDVLVFYRLDRLVRSIMHLWQLVEWADRPEVAVDLVSATEAVIDTSSAAGKLMVTMSATFAEMELEAIRERTKSSYHHLADQGLYTGGTPPFGYEPYKDPDTGEWRLRPEPEAARMIREFSARFVAGESLQSIVDELNRGGVMSPRDRNHVANGREPKGTRWNTRALKRLFQSPALMGYAVQGERVTDHHGKPIRSNGRYVYGDPAIRRNPDGTPIRRAAPILTEYEFDQLQAELSRRAITRASQNNKSNSLLLQVLYCAQCGKPMYKFRGSGYRKDRYRCGSHQDRVDGPCQNGAVLVSQIDEFVENSVLRIFGGSHKLERVWDPGEDHAQELNEVNRMLADLTDQLGTGVFRSGTPQRERLDQRIRELAERQEALSGSVTRTADWVWQPTGVLFKDWWGELTLKQKNDYLRDMGVRALVDAEKKSEKFDLEVELGQLDQMAQHLNLDDTAREVFARREILEASGSIGQVTVDKLTITAYAPDAPGQYDEYRKRGFAQFVELGASGTLALRPETALAEAVQAVRDGEPLPGGAELIN